MIQVYYMYCALYFYYYYISCTTGHQTLDLGGWKPCFISLLSEFYGHWSIGLSHPVAQQSGWLPFMLTDLFFGRNDAKAEAPVLWPPHAKSWLMTHRKRLWWWEGLGAGGEGDDRGWDGWMASWTRWMWVWVNSRRWWWIGRPGVLRFMGSQIVGHDWVTELNWTELTFSKNIPYRRIPSFCKHWI